MGARFEDGVGYKPRDAVDLHTLEKATNEFSSRASRVNAALLKH